jgi:hypothetical protein
MTVTFSMSFKTDKRYKKSEVLSQEQYYDQIDALPQHAFNVMVVSCLLQTSAYGLNAHAINGDTTPNARRLRAIARRLARQTNLVSEHALHTLTMVGPADEDAKREAQERDEALGKATELDV